MRILLLLCLLITPVVAAPVAMATDVRGSVKVGKQAATTLQQFDVNQELELAPQAHLELIFFGDGHKETVKGPAKVTVGKDGLKGAGVSKGEARSVAAAQAGRDFQRYGGDVTRGTDLGTELTTPAVVPPGPVELKWTRDIPGPYTVRVGGPLTLDAPWACISPAAQIWEVTTAANSITYAGPALQPDCTYWWEVITPTALDAVRRGLHVETSEAAQRREQELQALPSETYSDHVLRMLVLARDYRLPEALSEANQAIAIHPADVGLARFLKLLKEDLGQP